jgi:hypothetical protein
LDGPKFIIENIVLLKQKLANDYVNEDGTTKLDIFENAEDAFLMPCRKETSRLTGAITTFFRGGKKNMVQNRLFIVYQDKSITLMNAKTAKKNQIYYDNWGKQYISSITLPDFTADDSKLYFRIFVGDESRVIYPYSKKCLSNNEKQQKELIENVRGFLTSIRGQGVLERENEWKSHDAMKLFFNSNKLILDSFHQMDTESDYETFKKQIEAVLDKHKAWFSQPGYTYRRISRKLISAPKTSGRNDAFGKLTKSILDA